MMTTLLLQYQLLKTGGRTMDEHGNIIIYKDKDGNVVVDAIYKDETLWLTQKGMAKVFNCSIDNISRLRPSSFPSELLELSETTQRKQVQLPLHLLMRTYVLLV